MRDVTMFVEMFLHLAPYPGHEPSMFCVLIKNLWYFCYQSTKELGIPGKCDKAQEQCFVFGKKMLIGFSNNQFCDWKGTLTLKMADKKGNFFAKYYNTNMRFATLVKNNVKHISQQAWKLLGR